MSTPEQPAEAADQPQNEQNDEPAEPMFRVMIKNPTDTPGNAPFSLSLAPSTTVRGLKQTLSDSYPGNPATSAQRLIHAGKLLTDASTLASILPPDTDATHTMHLVVSTRNQPPPRSTPATQPPPVSNPPLQYPPNPPPFPHNLHNFPPNYNPYFAPLHGHPAPYPFPHPPPPPGAAPHFPHPDPQVYAHHLQAVERIVAHALNTIPQNPNDQAQRAQIAALLDAAAASLHGQPPLYPLPNQPPQNQNDQRHQNPDNQNPQQNQPQQNPPPNDPLGFDLRVHRQNAPRVRHFVFQFELNWSLIAKLAFLVYLLSQEGNTSRVYFLIITALGVYLWRLGHLRFLRGIIPTALPSPSRFANILFPARAPRFARARVALSFAYSFVYGFFCSLLPAWDPERMPDVIRLAEPEENEAASQATHGEPQTAGGEQPHEHAD